MIRLAEIHTAITVELLPLLFSYLKDSVHRRALAWFHAMTPASCDRLKSASGGAVAQLGARLDGIEEVVGSNPIGSTNFCISFVLLGAYLTVT